MKQAREEWVFHLSGGRLCLDFANTVSWRPSGQPIERLRTYRDFLRWSRQTGVLTSREATRLTREANRRPADAARILQEAVGIRELIYRVFSRIVEGAAPGSADIATLNAHLSDALGRLGVIAKADRFSLGWRADDKALERMLWPTVRSAVELLTSEDLRHVRKCAARNCGWIFLDTSRNRSRRWCDMRVCGNRTKVRRHYERQRAPAHSGRRRAPAR